MTFDRSQLRNLSPEARKFPHSIHHRLSQTARMFLAQHYKAQRKAKKLETDKSKAVGLTPLLKGWRCRRNHRFDYPLHVGVGACPVCGAPVEYVGEADAGATESEDVPMPDREKVEGMAQPVEVKSMGPQKIDWSDPDLPVLADGSGKGTGREPKNENPVS